MKECRQKKIQFEGWMLCRLTDRLHALQCISVMEQGLNTPKYTTIKSLKREIYYMKLMPLYWLLFFGMNEYLRRDTFVE